MRTLYSEALRHLPHVVERPGAADHPLIQWWFELCDLGRGVHDETPWCSAFVNGMAWNLDLPRSRSASARSWLQLARAIPVEEAVQGNDIVILSRPEAGPLAGHVGLFAALTPTSVQLLGGNQGNRISFQSFPRHRIVGVRRLEAL